MQRVYLDHAATTPIHPVVIESMLEVMRETFGNPSSTHAFGRDAKAVLESARKSIAKQIGAAASEIIFTSGGTEGDNWVIWNAVHHLRVQRIISTKVEHHGVLHPIQWVAQHTNIEVIYLNVNKQGAIDVEELIQILQVEKPTLVSLMHVNNEIGSVLDIHTLAQVCKQYKAFFHSDAVQTMGKIRMNVQDFPIDFLVASAHKFHGPKGVGFIFSRKNIPISAQILGGSQEKGVRAGTEALASIVGMATALELSLANLESHQTHISLLKDYAWNKIKTTFPNAKINGSEDGFYAVLNVCLPMSEELASMMVFHLDMKGIAISRGSACQSGSSKPSHVLAEILSDEDLRKPSIRISFSYTNTTEDIDALVQALTSVGQPFSLNKN